MNHLLPRRRFLQLSAGTGVALLTGCASSSLPSAASTRLANITAEPGRQPDVTAQLRAAPTDFELAGRTLRTWAYNAKVPGEVLRASKGDLVEVTVANALPEATSIHWHGLSIVNGMDGVPGLTQGDIEPGDEFTYRFVVPDAGTHWFHPHHGLQLDRGLLAPLIIEDPDDGVDADVEYVVMLDDWLDGAGTTPDDELDALTTMTMDDMGTMTMATSPLLGGDAGDVTYPYHLINGRPLDDPLTFAPAPRQGDRVRLRIINGAGDTAYRFAVGGHTMTVTHTDGFAVEPVDVDAILIGMGERYDVTIDVRSGAWPVVALAEGKGERAAAVLRTVDASSTSTPDLGAAIPELDGTWLRYADLRATEPASLELPADVDIRPVPLRLTGGMMQYDWGINGVAYGNHEPIQVAADEWISLQIENMSNMWHPVHLHGHTPQLGRGRAGVRKDTVNVLPSQSMEMVFQANNPGDWMIHCHNAYHLEAGMATTLSYVE
ncbi:MAG: multicopper oxidase family protein [Ilumatobacter sp.]|uniref:multicopper oxidase family protein n=1 Tax=Ilumatobacter sp. TaxID=1967498 RepID=UPI003C751D53